MILGIDLSLRGTGLADITIGKRVLNTHFLHIDGKHPKRMLQTEKDWLDVLELGRLLSGHIIRLMPEVIVVELPGGSQNARSAKTSGLAIGALAGAVGDIPTVWCTPQALKKAVTGKRAASKAQVAEGLRLGMGWGSDAKTKAHREAVTDAVAAVYTMWNHILVQHVRRAAGNYDADT